MCHGIIVGYMYIGVMIPVGIWKPLYIKSVDYYDVSQLIAIICCNNAYIYSILQVYISKCVETNRISLFMDVYPIIIDCVTLLLLYNTCTYVCRRNERDLP